MTPSLHILCAALLVLAAAPFAHAQQTAAPSCADALVDAEEHYASGELEAAQTLALECSESRTAAEALRARRLMALTLIRQGNIEEAQMAIVRILGLNYAYQPDANLDPPYYTALVETVKQQLRVEPRDAGAALQARPVRIAQATDPFPSGEGQETGGGRPSESTPTEARRPTERVNVNSASAEDLQAVSGIGPALARRLVAYRAAHGPFHTADDLQNVRGIGPRSVQRLASQLAFGNPAVAAAPPPASDTERGGDVTPPGPLVDLNSATLEELDALPGIGPALSARIIAFREERGKFRRVEDVLDVRGIGPKVLEGFADLVTVR